jgi:hypothetical protein
LIRNAVANAGRILAFAFALLSFLTLSSCGSGGVSGPPPVNDPTRITILPAGTTTAPVIAYSGLPTTFALSGGTGSYIVSSDNQSVIQISSGAINTSTLTVVPNPVTSDTTVTISVRDTGTAPVATSVVTVKPGTVNNNVTITPTSTACAPAICSGTDALVSTTISQGGIPLAARGVRFDVITGDFSFVTTDPVTLTQTLSSSYATTTDETGKANARIRIPPLAANQTALLQVTDLGAGAFQRTSFLIAQSTGTSPGFFTSPSSVTFQGTQQNQCAGTGVSAIVTVIGGVPPYTVQTSSSAFAVLPTQISQSGGSFVVSPTGVCVASPGTPILVTDSSGHTATTLVANIPGTQAPNPLTVAPTSVTLASCTGRASVTAAGGVSNNYFASSGSDAIDTNVSGNTISIFRHNPSAATAGPVNVGVSDGQSTASVIVNLVGAARGACPTTSTLTASPNTVTLTSCTVNQVGSTISGGSGSYSATSDTGSVGVSVSGSTVTIGRPAGTAAWTSPATVTVTDTTNPSASTTITVNGSGAGAAACP